MQGVLTVDLVKDFSPLGDGLIKAYITELPEAQDDLNRLATFVFRWGEIWTRRFVGKSEIYVTPDVNPQVIECIQMNREAVCGHMSQSRPRRCDGMRILLPELFVLCIRLAKEFGLPHTMTIHRLIAGTGFDIPIIQ